MERRRHGLTWPRLAEAAGVVLLLALAVACLQQADGSDGWQSWAWRVVGVSAGVLAVNVLVARLRLAWTATGRTARE